ncbi:MAG: thioredoxin domain-containing protein [Thermoanaerobaculia bacterium]
MDSERPSQSPPPLDADNLKSVLFTLAAIGAGAGAWSVFLWRELLRARAGGDPFCGFGDDGACVALWDGTFASAVHGLTGLPLAAWGVVWGLIACALPLASWLRSASPAAAGWRSATRVTALTGLAVVTLMLVVSVAAGSFCTSCALIYLLTVAYAAVASLRLKSPPTARGAAIAAAAALAFYLVLLYPGLRTPKSSGQALTEAVARAADTGDEAGSETAAPALEAFLASLPPDHRQGVANALYIYATSPVFAEQPPRAVTVGPADAEVRITDFSDTLCSHCADLHKAYAYLEASLPAGSFRVDSRHFPLDGNCNPHIERKADTDVRCLAARAQICMEGTPAAFDFATALFDHQGKLTSEMVLELSQPLAVRGELERCITRPETDDKLRQDIDYAWKYRPRGTPLVLINGRQGTSFESFLYAVILAGGRADHPAFASLPPPTFGS